MIRYSEVVHNHFKYRHAVDDHNNRWQSPISLEETWATKWWPRWVHAFLLGVTEVNCTLADNYLYGNDDNGQLQFRKEMAKELIHNRYLEQEESRNDPNTRRRTGAAHRLENLPRKKLWDWNCGIGDLVSATQMCFVPKKRLELIVIALWLSTDAMNALQNI